MVHRQLLGHDLILLLSGIALFAAAVSLDYFGYPESIQDVLGYTGSAMLFVVGLNYIYGRSERGRHLLSPKPFHVAVAVIFLALFVASVHAPNSILEQLTEFETEVLGAIPLYWVGYGLYKLAVRSRGVKAYQVAGWIPVGSLLLLIPMLFVSAFLFPENGLVFSVARVVVGFAPSVAFSVLLRRRVISLIRRNPEELEEYVAQRGKPLVGSKKGKAIAAVAVVVLFAFIGFVLYESSIHPFWAYNGAYADYYGSATLSNGNYAYSVNMTVISGATTVGNATFAKVAIQTLFTTPTESYSNRTTLMVELAAKTTNPFSLGSPLLRVPTSMDVEGRTLQATASQFAQQQYALDGYDAFAAFTIYENQCGVSLPVIITFNTSLGGQLIVRLVHTNIAGLLPSFPQALGLGAYCP